MEVEISTTKDLVEQVSYCAKTNTHPDLENKRTDGGRWTLAHEPTMIELASVFKSCPWVTIIVFPYKGGFRFCLREDFKK